MAHSCLTPRALLAGARQPRLAPVIATIALPVAALACTGGTTSGAAAPSAAAYAVTIAARGEEREPLAGVGVLRGADLLGKTGATGRLSLELHGTDGERVPLRLECPESFQSPSQPLVVGLWHPSEGSPAPTFEVECVPIVHSFVVGVAAENGAQLPISYLSQPIGQTDELGIAHVLVRAPSHEQISLTLDTSGRPELRPQNPSLAFVAGDAPELVLLQVKFAEQARPRRARPRRQIPIEIKH